MVCQDRSVDVEYPLPLLTATISKMNSLLWFFTTLNSTRAILSPSPGSRGLFRTTSASISLLCKTFKRISSLHSSLGEYTIKNETAGKIVMAETKNRTPGTLCNNSSSWTRRMTESSISAKQSYETNASAWHLRLAFYVYRLEFMSTDVLFDIWSRGRRYVLNRL